MQKIISFSAIVLISSLLFSCSTSTSQTSVSYNPETQETERYNNTPFYQLKTEILPGELSLLLVTHLNKETFPGAYTIKKVTRRLLPNDYMAQADTTLYLKNMTVQTVNFNLLAISIEHKRLPYSARQLSLLANESVSIHLGEVDVDLRLNTLNTRIEYIAQEHEEKEFDMLRNSRLNKEEEN
ncbi:MAG: hypothetical protein KAI17_13690 [Thiotrichaceae bacterium]|nr:hypothetical protein [Thiotrichaceae bacterium]